MFQGRVFTALKLLAILCAQILSPLCSHAENKCSDSSLRKLVVPRSLQKIPPPEKRLEAFLREHNRKPDWNEDSTARAWLVRMAKRAPESRPQGLSPSIQQLINETAESLSDSAKIPPQERVEQFVSEHQRLPGDADDSGAYQWTLHQRSTAKNQRPKDISPELSQLLENTKPYNGRRPDLFVENYLSDHGKLPDESVSPKAHRWIQEQLALDEAKWKVSPRLRTWLRHLKQKQAKMAATESTATATVTKKRTATPAPSAAVLKQREKETQATIEEFVRLNHKLPEEAKSTSVYKWIKKYLELPEKKWPTDISNELANLLRKAKNSKTKIIYKTPIDP